MYFIGIGSPGTCKVIVSRKLMPAQVNPYEDPESALIRELKEELSIEVRCNKAGLHALFQ